jgi:hypothetical protein
MVPSPEPFAPDVIVSHESALVAVHEHSAIVEILS